MQQSVKIYGAEQLATVAKTAFDADSFGKTPWTKLQLDLMIWANKLYGVQPFERMVLGIIEEMGEYEEAIVLDARDMIRDAIGDTSIFAMQLCTLFKLSYETLLTFTTRHELTVWASPIIMVKNLSQISLKTLQGTRGFGESGAGWLHTRSKMADAISDLAWMQEARANLECANYFDVVNATATEVMKRTRDLPALP